MSRAEESVSALRNNNVLEQRDAYLKTVDKEVPTKWTELARIQPVFGHPLLIGQPIVEMAEARTVSHATLASEALAHQASFSRGQARSGFKQGAARFQAPRGRGGTGYQNQNQIQRNNFQKRDGDCSTPAATRGGLAERPTPRGRGFQRGGHAGRRPFRAITRK